MTSVSACLQGVEESVSREMPWRVTTVQVSYAHPAAAE